MSEYGAITPTTNGLTMITESVVKKKPIVFTKIAIGDGALTNQNIETLTALIRQKQEAPIHIVTDKGAGLADVSAVITNVGLSTGYYARELGVFAKVGDAGQEKLFAYTNAGANASYSPADGSLDEKLITVTFKIGTGATLKVALNSQVYLTLGNLEEHNTSSSAHADIRRMFNSYLPLTGGTVTGRLYVNDAVFMGTETSQYGNFIERSKAGTMYLASGKSESSNLSWFNVDGYFKYTNTAEMCVIKRDENSNILARAFLLDQDNKTRFPGEVYSNGKLLATKEYVDTKGTNDINAHNTSGGAHADIRQMFNNYWSRAEADNRFLLSNHLSVTSGTVANGAGIPIPNGYVLNQCRFLVSFSDDNPSHYWYDINEGGVNQMDQRICRVKPGTNIVECYWVAQGYDGWYKSDRNTRLVLSGENELIDGKRYYKMPAIANYICIAVK